MTWLAAYLIGVGVVAVICARSRAWHRYHGGKIESIDAFLCLVLGVFWPVGVPLVLAIQFLVGVSSYGDKPCKRDG